MKAKSNPQQFIYPKAGEPFEEPRPAHEIGRTFQERDEDNLGNAINPPHLWPILSHGHSKVGEDDRV